MYIESHIMRSKSVKIVGKFSRLREHFYIPEMLTEWAKYAIYDKY